MHPLEIQNYILEHFDEIYRVDAWGEKSFFLNPGQRLKRGTYFATIKEKDGEHDRSSKLDREGIFRLNIGLNKTAFLSLFSHVPSRPPKGGVIEGNYDFEKVDLILPHPVYGWMGWVSVLNPSVSTFFSCKELLQDAYQKAKLLTDKKLKKL